MKSTTSALLLASLAAMSTLPAVAGEFVSPGLWEHTTQLSADGNTWRPTSSRRGCLTKPQAEQWESQVRQQILAQQCTINSLTVAGGKIAGVISCATANKPVVKVAGDYSNEAYAADLAADGVIDLTAVGGKKNAPVKVFARWTGRRIGSC